jgi:hypothetical protein
MVNEPMRGYEYALVRKPNLTNTLEVLQAIRGLKVGKAPDSNGISKSPETSTQVCDNLSDESVWRSPQQAVLPVSIKTRSRCVHSEAGKGHNTAFFL